MVCYAVMIMHRKATNTSIYKAISCDSTWTSNLVCTSMKFTCVFAQSNHAWPRHFYALPARLDPVSDFSPGSILTRLEKFQARSSPTTPMHRTPAALVIRFFFSSTLITATVCRVSCVVCLPFLPSYIHPTTCTCTAITCCVYVFVYYIISLSY